MLAVVLSVFIFSGTASAFTLQHTVINLTSINTKINISTCTWTFDRLDWESDYLYVEGLTVASNGVNTPLTFNFTQPNLNLDCDTFPYPVWVGSAGGSSTSSYDDDEDEYLELTDEEPEEEIEEEQPTGEETKDSDEDKSLIEKVKDKIESLFDDNKDGSGEKDSSGLKDKASAWINSQDWDNVKTWAVWIGAGLVAFFFVWFFWGLLLKIIVFVSQLLWVVVGVIWRLLFAGFVLLFGLIMTPIGLAILAGLALIGYVVYKIYFG